MSNSLTVIIGTFIAQVFPIIFYPLLSRMFLPSDFGLLATLTSTVTVIGCIASGKYETVVLIAPTKKDAADIIGLSLILSAFFLLGVYLFFLIGGEYIADKLDKPLLGYWILWSPFIAFCICVYQCYNEWCVRNKYFLNLSLNKIVNTSAITLSKVLFGLGKILTGGLILGEIAGRFISACACLGHALRKDYAVFRQMSFPRMKFFARRYKSCPCYIMPAQLLNTLGGELPVFLFAIFFTSSEIGFYAMALMVLSLPSSLISLAIRDVFRTRANDEYVKNHNCIGIYRKTLGALTILSAVGFSVFYMIAPSLFALVLGEEWQMAGVYARILCPMVAISFVTEVGGGMFIIAEKMKEAMWWQTGYLLLSVCSLFIGIYWGGNMIAVLICLTIGRSIAHLINFYMSMSFAKGK